MPTPLFRLDLTRHLAPALQLARARPHRDRLVAWAVRTLAQNTDGIDVINVERPGTLRPVEVLGAAWLDAVRRALGRESFDDVEAVVVQATEAFELGNKDAVSSSSSRPTGAPRARVALLATPSTASVQETRTARNTLMLRTMSSEGGT